MKTIVLIGSQGQLGTDILKAAQGDNTFTIVPLVHHNIEITDPKSIADRLDQVSADIVLNVAAYNKVDEIESEPEKAFLINALATRNLAQYCQAKNIVFTHISTDYVFGTDTEKQTPYVETDRPGPVNTYGISKLAGEYFIQYTCDKYFIIRSSGLFGSTGKNNFVETILGVALEKESVKVVDDQIVTPTYTLDLARQILKLLTTDAYGLYHASAEGQCSWYEFTKYIYELTDTKIPLFPISSDEYPLPAKRAHYSVLENKNLKNLGINIMRDWREGLKDYFHE